MRRRRRRTCSPRTPRRALLWSPQPRATRAAAAERTASTQSSSKAWGWARRRKRAQRTTWNWAACARHVHGMCNVHAMCMREHAHVCACVCMCACVRQVRRARPGAEWRGGGLVGDGAHVGARPDRRHQGLPAWRPVSRLHRRKCTARACAPHRTCPRPTARGPLHAARARCDVHMHMPHAHAHADAHAHLHVPHARAQVRHLPQPPRRG